MSPFHLQAALRELRRSLDVVADLRSLGAHVHEDVVVGANATFLGDDLDLSRLTIGSGARVGPACSFDLSGEVRIGKGAVIGPLVVFLTEGSTIVVGDRSIVGARSLICPGVTLGAGSVVVAMSVVRGDVAPGARVAGNPARATSPPAPSAPAPGAHAG